MQDDEEYEKQEVFDNINDDELLAELDRKEKERNRDNFMKGIENRLMSDLGMKRFQTLKREASADNEQARNRVITEMFLTKIANENKLEAQKAIYE